jgi:hypothetical protein
VLCETFLTVAKIVFAPLPDVTLDRLLDRIAEALRVGSDPTTLRKFPAWTQRVMRILQAQFVPHEYATILSADGSVLTEGIAVAWAAKAQDLVQTHQANGGGFARKLAERLGMDPKTQEVAVQVGSGVVPLTDEFQKHIMNRLFGPNVAERRAFVEGLAIGNRLPELLDRQALRNTTDATGIYLLLWLYWPEITKLKSVGEVARALEPFFATNKNLVGVHWEERVRKLANRIGLSFRAKQKRLRRRVGE